MSKTKICPPSEPQSLVAEVQLRLADVRELPRVQSLLRRHHYLGVWRPVGERLVYIAADKQGQWVGVLIFCAATQYLRHRDQWIGWTQAQRRRRLALVVNNARFLLLPYRTVPNLGSRVLKLALARLSADWQPQYGHPVLAVESLVDPEQFWGTVYTANGWQELGLQDGWGRHGRDYYVKHGQPKRLFVKELCQNARRSLQVDEKTNEIPVVRQRFQKLDLEGRYVSLDALHTQTETGLDLVLEHGAHYTLTVKDNQPGIHDTIKELLPEIPAAFPPEDSTRTRACTQERNRSRDEIRLLCTAPTTPEAVCFPAAAQVARVRRQTTDRQSETVALLTSAPPEELDAQTWLRLNRTGCSGIENGLHQRLDVSLDDDRCRVRNPNAMLVLGLFRRLGNSLFIEWRSHQTKPHYLMTSDFHTDMTAEAHRRALSMVTTTHPAFTRAP